MSGSGVPNDPSISPELRRFLDDLGRAQLRNNYSAVASPIATNDAKSGYSVGSRWIDIIANNAFVCVDSTTGAAIWKQTT